MLNRLHKFGTKYLLNWITAKSCFCSRSPRKIFERKHRPYIRIRRAGNAHSLMRVPYTASITIVLEPLVHLHPVFIAAQESETRHCFQPVERERNIVLDCIPVRQSVAEHILRLLDHFLSDELH